MVDRLTPLWTFEEFISEDDGEYVRYSDYAAREAERDGWRDAYHQACVDYSAIVKQTVEQEAELSALRARLEEADLDMDWVTTAHVFCDRLGIERKADAEHIASAIARLEAENRDLRAKLQEWGDAAKATDIYEYLAEALARNGTVGPKGIRQMVAYCAELRAKLETVEAETIERAVKRVKADKVIQGLVKARIFTVLRNLEPRK